MMGFPSPEDNEVSAAMTFTVNDIADRADNNVGNGECRTSTGTCTLRAAIQESNAVPGEDVITVPGGTYAVSIPPINDNLADNGDFDITGPLTINGAGAAATIIDAGPPPGGLAPEVRGLDRLLDIHPGARNVTVSGVTLREGYAAESGGAIRFGPGEEVVEVEGVPVVTTGTLRLLDVQILDSYSAKYGGGIHNVGRGRIELVGSTLSCNGASEGGAAVNNAADGTIVLAATTPSGTGWREWSVTAQVQAMYSGANNGFLIRDATEGGAGFEQQLHSREKAPDNPPQLVITFGP